MTNRRGWNLIRSPRWARQIMQRDPSIGLEAFLQRALEREYPGGERAAWSFRRQPDPASARTKTAARPAAPPAAYDREQRTPVTTGLRGTSPSSSSTAHGTDPVEQSSVRTADARPRPVPRPAPAAPYDAQAVLANPDNPLRRRFLEESTPSQEALLRSEAGVSRRLPGSVRDRRRCAACCADACRRTAQPCCSTPGSTTP